jgi:hypothetical protein
MENLMLDDPAFTTRIASTLGYLSPEPALHAFGLLLSASVAMRDNLLALVQICRQPPLTGKERATAGAATPKRR